jgi:hypothetical protein
MVRTLHLRLLFVRTNSVLSPVTPEFDQCDPFVRFSEDEEQYGPRHGQQTQIMKSVDLTQSRSTAGDEQDSLQHDFATNHNTASTLASIMTSPLTTKLTSLSAFIPFSWSAAARASPANICITPSSSGSSVGSLPSNPRLDSQVVPQRKQSPQPQPRGYVTRLQQLEKLKKRIQVEGKRHMSYGAVPHCKDCENGTVVL